MKKNMSNKDIYINTQALSKYFGAKEAVTLPTMVNYAIQKNLKNLTDSYEVIDKIRISIGMKYGVKVDGEDTYKIIPEKLEIAQKELEQLLEVEQLIEVRMIKLEDLKNIQLSSAQMQALLFMIEEE